MKAHQAEFVLEDFLSDPQGLKPNSCVTLVGATEVVPFPIR